MPAIKKRLTAEYLAEQQPEENGGDRQETPAISQSSPLLAAGVKRKATADEGPYLLKGLDGEVLLEKRKRTLPVAELKLANWLDGNFERKQDVRLSAHKVYTFYTDLCQQEGSTVVEITDFNKVKIN